MNNSLQSMVEKIFALNSAAEYAGGLVVVVISILSTNQLGRSIRKRLKKKHNVWTDYILGVIRFASPLVYVLLFFVVYKYYNVPKQVDQIVVYGLKVATILLCIRLVVGVLRSAVYLYLARHDETGEKVKQVRGIVLILSSVVWGVGLIFLLDNLGFDVTAILTGLGVGGIAIALAAQTILGDLFNYFVIFFDRPFEIGDFITVDDKLGTVEYIGLKTTRIRSLHGEQVVFSNTNLTNSRIHNYKRMQERRVLFKLSVVYETAHNKLEAIPKLLRTAVEQHNNTRFDRAHFLSFGEYSLNFEIVYYILSADYNSYMDIQQQINLDVHRTFHEQDIRFAYPTYLIRSNNSGKEFLNGDLKTTAQ